MLLSVYWTDISWYAIVKINILVICGLILLRKFKISYLKIVTVSISLGWSRDHFWWPDLTREMSEYVWQSTRVRKRVEKILKVLPPGRPGQVSCCCSQKCVHSVQIPCLSFPVMPRLPLHECSERVHALKGFTVKTYTIFFILLNTI